MATTKEVSILDLAKGAIQEQINLEAGRIMANIIDPNTDAKAVRKLNITITLKPDENREIVSYSAQAKSTLAPIKPISTSLIVDTDKDGNPVAAELTRNDPNQIHIFEDEEPVNNVLKLRSV
jgi:hypothetical protein